MEVVFMKKTMKKSALLSSVAMLIVSAIVLTSATYAWFSSSKVVAVEELDASVKVTTGLLISVDKGGEWGTQVDFADAVSVNGTWGAGYQNDMVFDPVSTADGETWISAVYNEDTSTLDTSAAVVGTNLVAVPLWVTGPVDANVKAVVKFDGTDSQAAKCMKFALVPANEAGDAVASGAYADAVAAEANADNKFMGISSAGTAATSGAYVSDGGKTINEVAADGGITFTIPAGTSTDAPMKYVAFLWLEGNDADCEMLKFDVAGEDVTFAMTLEIVD